MTANWWEQDEVVAPAPTAAPAPQQPAAAQPNWWHADEVVQAAPATQFERSAGDGPAAVGRGLINGVPIVGPYLLAGVNRAAAGIRSLQNDTRFSDELRNVEAFGQRTADAHPVATGAGEIFGGILGTAPAIAAAPAAFGVGAAALPLRAGASMLTGGAIGGADAAARGQDAGEGAAIGGALGFAAPFAGAGIGRAVGAIANRVRPTPVPTTPELKTAAQAAYQRADDLGVQIAAPAFQRGVQEVDDAVRAAGFNARLYPRVAAALDELQSAVGTPKSLKDVELLRRITKGAAGSIEPAERRIGSLMVDKLDNFTGSLTPADVVSGDAGAATAALGEARDLWSRYAKSRILETGMDRAERRASASGIGGNTANTMRQNVNSILNNDKLSRSFSAEEREAMDRLVRGSFIENRLRQVGRLSPSAGTLQGLTSIAATVHDPKLAAVPVAGTIAKILSDGIERGKVNRLAEAVRNGGPVTDSRAAIEARRRAEILARVLLAPAPALANQRR